MVGAFAFRAAPITAMLYALLEGALAVGIVVLGAMSLLVDFDFIERVSIDGAPSYMQWYAAYGLMLSIIWIYVSVLRLLALLRAGSR
jgi:uncharacterized YccA/Bax inhibitor family protein